MEMNTVEYQTNLPEEVKLSLLKAAKLGTWYDGWQPYCLQCSTMGRMSKMPYGFKCEGIGDWWGRRGCGNMIGWDLKGLK